MKTKSILLIFLLLVLSANLVNATTQDVSISLLNQDPDPAIAGDIIEIKLAIENKGDILDNLIIEIEPTYPFLEISGEELIEEVGSLQTTQSSGYSKVVKFNLKVDPDAKAGNYNLNVKYYEENGGYIIQDTVSIEVENEDSAEIIYIDQIELLPGKKTELKFTINNVGSSPLRDLTFSWSNEDEVILPVGSDDTKYIKSLGVGESTVLSYNVMADSSEDAGLYKLDLSLVYNDPITNEENIVNTIAGIYVGGETDFEVAFSDNSEGEMAFTIANIGSNDATSVSIKIPKQEAVKVNGASSNIIGNLNKGDYTVATFKMNANSEDILILIDYTDTTGERITTTKVVNTGISSNSDFQSTEGETKNMPGSRMGPGGMGNMTSGVSKLIPIVKWVGISLLILIIGIIGFKIHKKKQKQKKRQ